MLKNWLNLAAQNDNRENQEYRLEAEHLPNGDRPGRQCGQTAQIEIAFFRRVKIGARGRCQSERNSMRRILDALLRLMTAGDDFDRGAAMIAKLSEQFAHLRFVERIASGMGNDSNAAATVDPLYRVVEARPLMRDETGLTGAKKTLECNLHVFNRAALDE